MIRISTLHAIERVLLATILLLAATEAVAQSDAAGSRDHPLFNRMAGFWIEDGVVAFPVEEITIAGNLNAMFRDIVAVGSDVDRRGSRHVGSILVGRMTVAGK